MKPVSHRVPRRYYSRSVRHVDRPYLNRGLKLLIMVLIFSAVYVLVMYTDNSARTFFFTPQPKQLNLLARDWQTVSFYIPEEPLRSDGFGYGPFIAFGAGYHTKPRPGDVAGKTQYMNINIEGKSINGQSGASAITVTGKITMLKVGAYLPSVEYDAGRYYLRLVSETTSLTFKPPFQVIPSQMLDHLQVVFQSEGASTITFRPKTSTDFEWGYRPHLQVLSNEPSYFHLNLLPRCHLMMRRSFDLVSQTKNYVKIEHDCWATSGESEDEYTGSHLRFALSGMPAGESALVLVPDSLQIYVPGLGTIQNSHNEYLVIVRQTESYPSHIANYHILETVSVAHHDEFSVHLTSDSNNPEEPLLLVSPATQTIEVTRPLGRIATGLDSISVDGLSEVIVKLTDWPDLSWRNDIIINENGSEEAQQFLTVSGTTDSVTINNEQIITSQWEALDSEVKSGILGFVGGIFGAGATLFAVLLANANGKEPLTVMPSSRVRIVSRQPVKASPQASQPQGRRTTPLHAPQGRLTKPLSSTDLP